MSAIVPDVDPKKRRFLIAATSVVGAGATATVAVPFVGSMFPSARALAAGAAVEYDISKVEPGQLVTVEYRGAPHWIIRRSPEQVAQLAKNDALLADPMSEKSSQPAFAKTLPTFLGGPQGEITVRLDNFRPLICHSHVPPYETG